MTHKPIARTMQELHDWMALTMPDAAAKIVIFGNAAYAMDDLVQCSLCECTSLDEDVTDGICEPCRVETGQVEMFGE